jgi:guanine deaminase
MPVLIRGGHVLSRDGATLERADILIDGDRIAAVGAAVAAPPGTQEIDATGRLVLPGLINTHTHAHTGLTRGRARNWTLEDLLNHGAALNGGRTPEEHYLSAAILAVEMVKTGCTAAYDLAIYFPAPTEEAFAATVQAYTDVGMRVILAPAMADVVFYRTVPGLLDLLPDDLRRTVESMQPAPTDELLRFAEQAIRRWDGTAGGRIRVAVAPTIPGQATDDFLIGCGRVAREHGTGLHTHLAESKVQCVYSQQRWGTTIVAQLAAMGLLTDGFVGAHAVWLTDEDIRRMADAGAAVAHNPASNLRLGSGIAPIREMLDHGVTVGIGTDGSVCADNQDVFEAMRFASLVSTVRFPHQQERWLDGETIWHLATAGGARVLGMGDQIGAVEPGRKADLVLLRTNAVFQRPLNRAVNTLVYAESGANVETVLVDGRVILDHGRMATIDEDRLYARVQEAADRQRERTAKDWALAEALTPYLAQACRAAVATPFAVNRYAVPITGHA